MEKQIKRTILEQGRDWFESDRKVILASITFLSDSNQSLPCSKIVLLICFSIKEIYLFSFFYL